MFKMSFKKYIMLGAVGASFVATPFAVQAEDGSKHHKRGEKMMEKLFEKQDTDGDGAISKVEATAAADERFSKMDADADGKLTKEEIKAHHESMRAEWKERKGEKHEEMDAPSEE